VAGVFVTGTGTDVGKTFVTAALVRHLRSAGKTVDAFKPVVSGFDPTNIANGDPGVLLSALGRDVTNDELDRIAPWRFAAPLSPDLAAKAESRSIDFAALMVPLDRTHTVLDWMSALRIPVLLVAGSYLGTISHTLTALHVLAQRNLDIAGVVVSESTAPGASCDDTVATIARFAVPIEVIGVPRLQPGAPPPPDVLSRIERLL